MPIPENPQSRSEQYLNAIATGDNSGLPAFPESRMEQYLEVIAQNGGGSSGGGVLIVTVGVDDKCDASYNDVVSAYEAGKVVILKIPNSGVPPFILWYLGGYAYDSEHGCMVLFGEHQNIVCVSASQTDPLTYVAS